MRRNANPRRGILWRLMALGLAATALWSVHVASARASTLFDSHAPLRFSLEVPFGTLLRQRADAKYLDARLIGPFAGGTETTLDLRVRVRGKSRLKSCSFPPLLLNFRTEGLAGTDLEGENRLKLVTHCDSSRTYDQYVLLEYLSYRILNLLTDASLRARLVEVRYFDTERERELATRPGILLEDEERFAARLGFAPHETTERIDPAGYDPHTLALLDVFQYFIGNTDWSALAGPAGDTCCHNVVPIARPDNVLLPVPYDFDSAGIVNTPYALPDERLNIRTVRQRLYRGACRPAEELQPIFAEFAAEHEAITSLVQQQAGLSESVAKRTLDYIEEFYETLAEPAAAQRAFRVRCEER